jgi:hypothetical protein
MDAKWLAYTGHDATTDLTTRPGWVILGQGAKIQAVSAGDWTIECEVVRRNELAAGFGNEGLLLTNGTASASTIRAVWGMGGDNTLGTARFVFEKFTNGAFTSAYSQQTGRREIPHHYFLRINKTSTTYRVDYAFGMASWTFTTFATTSALGFTPTHFGIHSGSGVSAFNYFLRY